MVRSGTVDVHVYSTDSPQRGSPDSPRLSRPASFACRALCNVAITEKRVYLDVTIVIHVAKSPRLSLCCFYASKVILCAFAEEGEPENEAN